MKLTSNRSILFALIYFQVITLAKPQILDNVSHVLENITEKKPPVLSNQQSQSSLQPPEASASPVFSPSPPPPPVQTTSTLLVATSSPIATSSLPVQYTSGNPIALPPTTSSLTTSSASSENTSNATPTSTPSKGGSKSKTNKETVVTDSVDTSLPTVTDNSAQSTQLNKSSNNNNSGNKTGIIIGAVVGSIFGAALIGGLLTWINRHGGCARRNNKRSTDFEDYGLADTDFPQQHLQSPVMQTVTASNSPALGGAIAPTIPRLNDQGNFYNNNASEDLYGNNQHQFDASYSLPMGHQPTTVEYNNPQSMIDYNQQQPYYYQQSQDAVNNGRYYDEPTYYNNQHTQGYDAQFNQLQQQQQQQQQQQHAYLGPNPYPSTQMVGDHYYKPDQVDVTHHQRM